jgi:hypothetical protein
VEDLSRYLRSAEGPFFSNPGAWLAPWAPHHRSSWISPRFPSGSSRWLERGDGVAIRWRQLRAIRPRCPVADPFETGITRSRRCHRVCRPAASFDWTSLARCEPFSGVSLGPPQAPPIDLVRPGASERRDLATATLDSPAGRGPLPTPPVRERSVENPKTPATVPASREPSSSVPDLVRYPLQIPSELRAPLHPTLFPPDAASNDPGGDGTELVRECVRPSFDFPATAVRDAACRSTATQDCYEHPRLVDFPATSMNDLRHPRRAGRARCFTTPIPPEWTSASTGEAFPPALVSCRRPPDAPVARSIRGPGFREESRGAAPRWQRTLVNRAKIASTAGP